MAESEADYYATRTREIRLDTGIEAPYVEPALSSAFCTACLRGNLEEVRRLLDGGQSMDHSDTGVTE
jgi:hypothetical protein